MFLAILKLYLWFIHVANNLILVISFGFKLNSNLDQLTISLVGMFPLWVPPSPPPQHYHPSPLTVFWHTASKGCYYHRNHLSFFLVFALFHGRNGVTQCIIPNTIVSKCLHYELIQFVTKTLVLLLKQDTQRNMYHRECFWFVYQSEVLLLSETQPHTGEVCASVRDTEMGEGRGGGDYLSDLICFTSTLF